MIERLRQRLVSVLRLRGVWKRRALKAESKLPLYDWGPEVERWRSLVWYYLTAYGGAKTTRETLEIMLGVMFGESGGDSQAVSRVEWIGPEPPGYDANDPATKASGLFQHIPAYWGARSLAAGFGGRSILDAEANIAVACYVLFASWPDAMTPHWHHWSGAHVGVDGSYEKAVKRLREAGVL